MNRSQMRVFDDLLSIGAERPFAPDGLADHLENILLKGTQDAVASWTENSLWLSKSQLQTTRSCETWLVATQGEARDTRMNTATAVGIIAHRAIRTSYSRPGVLHDLVQWAVETSVAEDNGVREFWEEASPGLQAEVINQATDRVAGYLDSWPTLQPNWEPRFEVPLQAKIGKLTLAGRVDLLLGRPRVPRQTMLLCDFKTGSLHDGHTFEAGFYALLATLRYGIPPYRSVVYSLASGEWTRPADVRAETLEQTAHEVSGLVSRYVEVLTEKSEPSLHPGKWCGWCPKQNTCPAAAAMKLEQMTTPVAVSEPVEVKLGGSGGSGGAHGPFTL